MSFEYNTEEDILRVRRRGIKIYESLDASKVLGLSKEFLSNLKNAKLSMIQSKFGFVIAFRIANFHISFLLNLFKLSFL